MHKRNVTANFNVKQICIDLVTIIAAYLAADFLHLVVHQSSVLLTHSWMVVIYGTVFCLSMLMFRMYNVTTHYYWDRLIQRALWSAVIAGFCIGQVVFLVKFDSPSRLLFLSFWGLSFALVLAERLVLQWTVRAHIGNGYTHVLFVGDDLVKERYTHFLKKTAMKLKFDLHLHYGSPELQSPARFETLLKGLSVHEVHFVYSGSGRGREDLDSYLRVCEDMGITTRLILDMYTPPNSQRFVSSVGTFPVLTYHSVSLDRVQLFFKGVIDVVGSLMGLLLLSPVFVLTAIAIRLESPGPVFFTQVRVGRNGRRFKIYKFRSMYMDAEERKQELMARNKIKGGLMFKLDDDPRITRVGAFIRKTSIDELPQLFNVLKRDMSLVGTRPPTTDEVEKYHRSHWSRISIMPGITGMWQVSGRSNIIDFDQVVQLDKLYIDQWSLALDMKLMLKTITVVLGRKGAS